MMCSAVWGSPELVDSDSSTGNLQTTNEAVEFFASWPDQVLQLEKGEEPINLVRFRSLRVPVNIPDGHLLYGYSQSIRFGMTRTPDVRVVIMAELAGTVKVIEFDYGLFNEPPQVVPLQIATVFSPQGLESGGAGVMGVSGPATYYTATLTILIQRRSHEGYGLVNIDSLDVMALFNPSLHSS